MWIYEKKLQYPVKIKNPNPALAKEIEDQIRAMSERTADMITDPTIADSETEGDDEFDIQLLKDDGLGIDD